MCAQWWLCARHTTFLTCFSSLQLHKIGINDSTSEMRNLELYKCQVPCARLEIVYLGLESKPNPNLETFLFPLHLGRTQFLVPAWQESHSASWSKLCIVLPSVRLGLRWEQTRWCPKRFLAPSSLRVVKKEMCVELVLISVSLALPWHPASPKNT